MQNDPVSRETFQVGDAVEKYTGDYQLKGEVRAVFTTKAGKTRYVVEHEPGFLHIYSGANIRKLPLEGIADLDSIVIVPCGTIKRMAGQR